MCAGYLKLHTHTHTHTQNMQYLLLSHYNNGCTNVPHCYVIRTVHCLSCVLTHRLITTPQRSGVNQWHLQGAPFNCSSRHIKRLEALVGRRLKDRGFSHKCTLFDYHQSLFTVGCHYSVVHTLKPVLHLKYIFKSICVRNCDLTTWGRVTAVI